MILKFLRLFAAFRSLEQDRDTTVAQLREALQDADTQRLLLQDRLDAMASDRGELWGMVKSAIENERETLRMQANFTTQSKYGITPYPEATHLPPSMESPELNEPFGRRLMPSELMGRRTTQFFKEFASRKQRPADTK